MKIGDGDKKEFLMSKFCGLGFSNRNFSATYFACECYFRALFQNVSKIDLQADKIGRGNWTFNSNMVLEIVDNITAIKTKITEEYCIEIVC